MPIKVWDEITYPFPNFNGYTVIKLVIRYAEFHGNLWEI